MKTMRMTMNLVAAGVFLLCAASAMALPTAGQWVKITNDGGYGSTNGGEFQIDIGNNGSYDFTSFCVELDEYIVNRGVYWLYDVSDNAYGGGVNTAGGYDPVSSATQWTIYTYLYGTAFGTKSDALANNVQNTIWWLEGEISSTDWETTKYDGARNFYSSYVMNNWNASYDAYVTVLNLRDKELACGSILKQSQIIAERAPVPEPTTMLLFGTGLAGLAGVARRRRSH